MKKILLFTLMLFANIAHSENRNVEFQNGWIKQLPPSIPMRAAYMQISNASSLPIKITAMQSTAFEKVEMHETIMADGMMKMIPLDGIDIPAKGRVELKPGAKHLMLISPRQTLQIGDRIELIVTFSDASTQTVQLEVKP